VFQTLGLSNCLLRAGVDFRALMAEQVNNQDEHNVWRMSLLLH